MAKKAKVGDVLEIAAPDGLIYVHYVGKHPTYGDAIAVSPRVHASRAPASPELFRDAYVTFYPATAAVAQGLATVVGHLPSPGVPQRMRRPGAVQGGTVSTWIIQDGRQQVVKEKLTPEENRLPIAGIWNHEFLVRRVSQGWRPEDGMGPPAGARPRPAAAHAPESTTGAVPVSHYLYFPDRKEAARIAERLRNQGFTTEERLGADGKSWLVLATRPLVPSEEAFAAERRRMEELAGVGGGEYDGWEAETGDGE